MPVRVVRRAPDQAERFGGSRALLGCVVVELRRVDAPTSSSTRSACRFSRAPKLRAVLVEDPDIKVELSRDNGLRNIVEDGFDAGVRLGESVEKDKVTVRIGPDWRLVAVASLAVLVG